MLTVSAWSEKEDGTRIAQMTASDTVVTLDGVVQRSGGASGDRLQYKLVPENPAAGDETSIRWSSAVKMPTATATRLR